MNKKPFRLGKQYLEYVQFYLHNRKSVPNHKFRSDGQISENVVNVKPRRLKFDFGVVGKEEKFYEFSPAPCQVFVSVQYS